MEARHVPDFDWRYLCGRCGARYLAGLDARGYFITAPPCPKCGSDQRLLTYTEPAAGRRHGKRDRGQPAQPDLFPT